MKVKQNFISNITKKLLNAVGIRRTPENKFGECHGEAFKALADELKMSEKECHLAEKVYFQGLIEFYLAKDFASTSDSTSHAYAKFRLDYAKSIKNYLRSGFRLALKAKLIAKARVEAAFAGSSDGDTSTSKHILKSREAAIYIVTAPKSMTRVVRKNNIPLVKIPNLNGNFFRIADLDFYLSQKTKATMESGNADLRRKI
jgi:hypothetical protein